MKSQRPIRPNLVRPAVPMTTKKKARRGDFSKKSNVHFASMLFASEGSPLLDFDFSVKPLRFPIDLAKKRCCPDSDLWERSVGSLLSTSSPSSAFRCPCTLDFTPGARADDEESGVCVRSEKLDGSRNMKSRRLMLVSVILACIRFGAVGAERIWSL